jgi:hypothetical protein
LALKIQNVDSNYVIQTTKSWCRAIISRQGEKICPYTIDENAAGIGSPGLIRYAISQASNIENAHKEYWDEVSFILNSSQDDVSTTLLIYPQLDLMSNMEEFDIFSEELDDEIKNRELDATINNVYFHPEFNFRDKDGQIVVLFDDEGNVIGDSGSLVTPASYARRSPWPIVNILRSQMVKEAQKFVPEGKIFSQNVEKLEERGTKALQQMLEEHNWDAILASKDTTWTEITSNKQDNPNENEYDNNTSDESDDFNLDDYLDLADKFLTN